VENRSLTENELRGFVSGSVPDPVLLTFDEGIGNLSIVVGVHGVVE